MEATYWNGQPCKATKVRVVVGKAEKPTYWYAKLEGTVRNAVKIQYENTHFYIDNENGDGWIKVTRGLGSPQYGHGSLSVDREET